MMTPAPLGQGIAPSNALFYVTHSPQETVQWQLDARGWAIGYRIVKNGN